MRNNLLFTSGGTTQYCVYEENNLDDYSNPSSFLNNDLDCGILYHDYDLVTPVDITLIADVNALADITSVGANENIAPVFVGGTFQLDATADVKLKSGGLDLSAATPAVTTDAEGNPRTGNGSTGFSMGAYEQDN